MLGKNQLALLKFLTKYPSEWHSYDNSVKRTVNSLVKRGLITVNEFQQMTLSKGLNTHANNYYL